MDKQKNKKLDELSELTPLFPSHISNLRNVHEYSICMKDIDWKNTISETGIRQIEEIKDLYIKCPLSGIKLAGIAALTHRKNFLLTQTLQELFYNYLRDSLNQVQNAAKITDAIKIILAFLDDYPGCHHDNISLCSDILIDLYAEVSRNDPLFVAKILRDRNTNLEKGAGGIWIGSNENLISWHKLSGLLVDADPTVAKSILISLLRIRNFESIKDIPANNIPDMRSIGLELYEYEIKEPESSEIGKFNALYFLVNHGFPDSEYWPICLEKGFYQSCKIMNENWWQSLRFITQIAFYSHKNLNLQEEALNFLDQNIRITKNFGDERNAISRHAQFISVVDRFCTKKLDSSRNISFPKDPSNKLSKYIRKIFWEHVNAHIKQNSPDALVYLFEAIKGDDAAFSFEAADCYLKYFKRIAKAQPWAASKNLWFVAHFATCLYSTSETKHQNELLIDVFDSVIDDLYKLNRELGENAMKGFLGSHKSIPVKIAKNHNEKIMNMNKRGE